MSSLFYVEKQIPAVDVINNEVKALGGLESVMQLKDKRVRQGQKNLPLQISGFFEALVHDQRLLDGLHGIELSLIEIHGEAVPD